MQSHWYVNRRAGLQLDTSRWSDKLSSARGHMNDFLLSLMNVTRGSRTFRKVSYANRHALSWRVLRSDTQVPGTTRQVVTHRLFPRDASEPVFSHSQRPLVSNGGARLGSVQQTFPITLSTTLTRPQSPVKVGTPAWAQGGAPSSCTHDAIGTRSHAILRDRLKAPDHCLTSSRLTTILKMP